MNIKCTNCGNIQVYKLRAKIPKRPRAKCQLCGELFYFKLDVSKEQLALPKKSMKEQIKKIGLKFEKIKEEQKIKKSIKYIPQITDEMSAYRLLFGTSIRESKVKILKEMYKKLPDLISEMSNADL